jgi:PAS domain S-box-containing protein
MPEDQALVVGTHRTRTWLKVTIIAVVAVSFLSIVAVRRYSLRRDAIQNWSARSSVIAQLTSTSATNWVNARQGDTRLISRSASNSPQVFGVPTPGKPVLAPAKISASLIQSLTTINQLHAYTAIWLFDRDGKVIGTTSTTPPTAAIRNAARQSLTADSGAVYGPFPSASKDLTIAFAQRVLLMPRAREGATASEVNIAIGSVVLTSNAIPLLTELAAWSEHSKTEATSLVVAAGDSVHEYTLAPGKSTQALLGTWPRNNTPLRARAIFAARTDTTARIYGSRVNFGSRIDHLPWALTRGEDADAVFAMVNGKLRTEVSTALALLFMIAVVFNARRQANSDRELRAISESEHRYRLLAANSTDIIVRHAPDGRIVYISPAVSTILGYQPRQLEGRYPAELFHEDDPTTMNDIVEQLRKTTGTTRVEHRLRHADGHYVWLETTGRAVREPVWGAITELVTVSRDIEARKLAEQALRASEEEYRILFEANPLPMWAFDANTATFVAVNDAAVAYYGYSREEFLGMTIFDIRPSEDAEEMRRRVADVQAGIKHLHGSRHRKKDGTIVNVDLAVHEVKLSGRMTWLVLVKDVTEATRAANALRESNEFIRALFDSSPVAIIATDLDLRVIQWNGAAERLFGWTTEEAIGKLYPIATEAMWSEVRRSHEQALRDGRFNDMQAHRCRKDGVTVDINQSIGVIRDADLKPRGFVLLAADLSERAKLEAQLRHAQKMDAVGQLAGGVAHDFNNLLTVVTGYAGLLLAELPADDKIRPDIEEIKGAADRAAVLTRQLLAFSRQQMLEPTILDLNTVVEGMEHMLRRVLPSDIKVNMALQPSLGAVSADPGQLEQVLMNLIVNARDAMPTGGILTIETMEFKLDAESGTERADAAPGDYVMLAVSDTGCGMTKAVQARIFEPFFTTKERGKGTGLGLSTAHGIVTQSGGYLSVYSEPALGTTFKVCLPRVASPTGAATQELPAEKVTHGAEVILLVEDDPSVRNTAMRILERAGYTVFPASDGREALDIYDQHRSGIDLVMTDMIMPEMSGRELVARVRQRDSNVAVLIMSGYTEQTSRSQSFLEPGSVFIQKPFTPESLTAKVRSALNASKPELVP